MLKGWHTSVTFLRSFKNIGGGGAVELRTMYWSVSAGKTITACDKSTSTWMKALVQLVNKQKLLLQSYKVVK